MEAVGRLRARWIAGVENGFQVWEMRWLRERTPGKGESGGRLVAPFTEKGAKPAVWF